MYKNILPGRGFSQDSRVFTDFLLFLSGVDVDKRRKVLRFLTGAPRLPVGGFSDLHPKMTVVHKSDVDLYADQCLPSVMTCKNYLKLPQYSTKEILYEKFNMAIEEGQENFSLS